MDKNCAMKLTLWQNLQMLFLNRAFLRREKREGWTDYLPIYAVKCKRHGLYETYPMGNEGYFLCPKCLHESVRKAKR